MSGLAWNHANTVGVQAMDDQHGILMDTVNELRQQLLRGEKLDQIGKKLDRLVEFTGMHFQCEESLLEKHQFPGLKEHRAEHQRLLNEIKEAVERADHGAAANIQPLLAFLRDWYSSHVENLDRQYSDWLNTHGIY